MKRRDFLQDFGKAAFATWLGLDFLGELNEALAIPAKLTESAPASTRRGILQLRLQGFKLREMQEFYANTIGFAVELSTGRLQVQAGGTVIQFDEISEKGFSATDLPHYHIAWAIPQSKFAKAKAWLADRTPLLRHRDGRDEFHFRRARRRAVYFADPMGSILELIARDDMPDKSPGDFALADILYVNHIGLVVDDMTTAIEQIGHSLGLELTAEPSPNFVKLGDAHRHLTLVTRNRLWLPEGKLAANVYKTEAVLHGERSKRFVFENYPYSLSTQA